MRILTTLLSQPAVIVWLVKATALLLVAIAATAGLRRASAGTRHLVWVGTLAGILLLPALSFWTPIRLPVLPASLIGIGLPSVSPRMDVVASSANPPRLTSVGTASASPAEPGAGHSVAAQPTGKPSTGTTPREQQISLGTALLLIWSAATLVLLGWLAFGALAVRRIVRSGRPLDEDQAWTAPLCEIADRLDLDAVPRLLASDRVEMPFACGVVRPTVVLPASAEQWNDSRRRAVLFHELAHVKRHDLLGHTLGRLACAFYWFHPLVWTAARRLRAESERACDDLVLSCGARASDYADHLLDIVISVRRYGAPATAMPMARRRELEGRVLAILDPAVQRIGPGRLQSLGVVGTLAVLALCIAAMAPKHVARVTDAGRDTKGAWQRSGADAVASAPTTLAEAARHVGSMRAPSARPASRAETPAPIGAPVPAATPAASPAPTPKIGVSPALSMADAFSLSLGSATSTVVRAAASAIAGTTGKRVRGGEPAVDSAKVALLLKVLRSDQDASVRKMAAWGLSEAADAPEVVAALVDALRHDDDGDVREMAAWAMSDSHRAAAQRALAEALRSDDSDEVRETAAWALGNSQSEDQRGALEEALTSDPSAEVREEAAWGLGYSPRRPAAHALVVALRDKSSEVRESAAWALAEIQDEDTAPAITDAFMKETNSEVRTAELRALTFLHVDDKDILDAALASKDAELRARAVRMLAGAGAGVWPEPRPRPRPRPMP